MTSRHDSNSGLTPHEPRLSAEDQRVLDALVEAGFEPSRLSPADQPRAQVLAGLFGLMKDYPVEDADETLLHATMARIDQHERALAERMRFDVAQEAAVASETAAASRRFMLPNFITVAAVLLIGVSVMWPMMTNMRNQAMDEACANNLRLMGYGFQEFAADNNNQLPVAQAGFLNLQPLLQGGYCQKGHLNCPGHHHYAGGDAGPSYSCRLFFPGDAIAWNTGRLTVLMGDQNPVMQAFQGGRQIPPLSGSINHAGRGQNVLSTDGSTLWLEMPVIGRGDNIWLPEGANQFRADLTPRNPLDVVLMH